MSTAMPKQHVDRAIVVGRDREDIMVGDEIVRHRRISRLIHWGVAVTFFLGLITGMPIWTPIFGWMASLVGGLHVARLIHPYAGILFVVFSIFQFIEWLGDMHFEGDEREWWRPRKILSYMRWEDETTSEGGKYNGGQKLFFWAVTLGALGFLLTGVVLWFPLRFRGIPHEIAVIVHDITFIFFVVGVILHIYLGTAAEPGTFRSMTRGTVTRSWARFHHPGWFRKVSGEKTDEGRPPAKQ